MLPECALVERGLSNKDRNTWRSFQDTVGMRATKSGMPSGTHPLKKDERLLPARFDHCVACIKNFEKEDDK